MTQENKHSDYKANLILLFAVDDNWNIGYKGDLLVKVSNDLKRFKKLTTDNIIVMGRKTFESLPGGKALPNRINIVVTRDKDYKAEGVIVVHSPSELIDKLKELNPDNKMENYLIGGGNVSESLMDHCSKAYITKVFKAFEKADASMPNLDKDDTWKIVYESEVIRDEKLGLDYQYVEYGRVEK